MLTGYIKMLNMVNIISAKHPRYDAAFSSKHHFASMAVDSQFVDYRINKLTANSCGHSFSNCELG